jgi:hypothetical protein
MSWADLHGIDTHGISMVPPYDERRRLGKIDMRAKPAVVKETPVSALVDGGGGLGHPNARLAMDLAIDKAKKIGIGVAVVRNSAHFGACGFYALIPVDSGLIGMVTTSASGIRVAPTNGAQARLGTDRCLRRAGQARRAVPARRSVTTVAAGKIRNKANENLPAPPAGWSPDGQPSTDPREVSKGGFATPLGGTPEGSSPRATGWGRWSTSCHQPGRHDGDRPDAPEARHDGHRPLLPGDGSRPVPRCRRLPRRRRRRCDTLRHQASRSGATGDSRQRPERHIAAQRLKAGSRSAQPARQAARDRDCVRRRESSATSFSAFDVSAIGAVGASRDAPSLLHTG